MALTREQRRVLERTTCLYSAQLTDEAGDAIAAANLSTLTLTLYDQVSKAIINARDDQDVLNANNVTVDASGNLQWTLQPDDNPIIGARRAGLTETHIALFEWTWNAGSKQGRHEVTIEVQQIEKVPT
jgi:hypothetical protein